MEGSGGGGETPEEAPAAPQERDDAGSYPNCVAGGREVGMSGMTRR